MKLLYLKNMGGRKLWGQIVFDGDKVLCSPKQAVIIEWRRFCRWCIR